MVHASVAAGGTPSVAAKTVPAVEARELTKNLVKLAETDIVPDMLTRVTLQQCSELKTCAAGCERALHAARENDSDMRGPLLSSCFTALKTEHQASGISADAWFAKYFGLYVDRARMSLTPADQKRLNQARQKLRL